MKTSEPSLADTLREVTKIIPVAKRLLIADHIARLQKALGSEENLLVDYRTIKPKMTPERIAARAELRKANALAKDPDKDYTYIVSFMGCGSWQQCTLEEAAKLVRLSANSLRAHVSKDTWYSRTTDNEFGVTDIAEVCRCHSNGEPRVPKAEFLKKHRAMLEERQVTRQRNSGHRA